MLRTIADLLAQQFFFKFKIRLLMQHFALLKKNQNSLSRFSF